MKANPADFESWTALIHEAEKSVGAIGCLSTGIQRQRPCLFVLFLILRRCSNVGSEIAMPFVFVDLRSAVSHGTWTPWL